MTLLLGSVYEQFGDYDAGVRILRQALASAVQLRDTQTEAPVRERLASLLREQGSWVEALAEFEQAATLYGGGSRAWYPRLNAADLQWRMGRRSEAVRGFDSVERTLSAEPNPRLGSDLNLRRAEMAYAEGDMGRAGALIGQSAEPEARLIAAVLAIRGRKQNAGDLIAAAIGNLERARLNGRAAAARLAGAEAMLAAGSRDSALELSREALGFFEPRRIWEAVFRAHAIAARASAPGTEAQDHATRARAALAALRDSWPSAVVADYLKRPDIRTISQELKP